MTVEKGSKKYEVVDHYTYYSIKLVTSDKIKVDVNLSKKDFKSIDEVEKYIIENDMF